MNTVINQDNEEVKVGGAVQGSKLALLIASIPNDKMREALSHVAQSATGAQIALLTELVERAFFNSQTDALDAQFQKDLERIKNNMEMQGKRAYSDAMQKLEDVARRIS